MLVFVDEAGDTGFKFADNSSRYFVVALVMFSDEEEAQKARQRIDSLRHELRQPKIEFHFAKNKRETRKAFLSAVQSLPFTAFALVVDKSRLSPQELPDRATFYRSVCGTAFERARHLLQDAGVQFDDSGNTAFKRDLASYLRRRTNSTGTRHIKMVGTQKSSASNFIQLADMICGAIYRSFQGEKEGGQYREMVKHRITEVLVWPEEESTGS